jgi:hypothetical protein
VVPPAATPASQPEGGKVVVVEDLEEVLYLFLGENSDEGTRLLKKFG